MRCTKPLAAKIDGGMAVVAIATLGRCKRGPGKLDGKSRDEKQEQPGVDIAGARMPGESEKSIRGGGHEWILRVARLQLEWEL